MALIVNGVARYTVNQTLEGNVVANIVDMFVETTGSVVSRNQAVFEMAGRLINSWRSNLLPFAVDDLTFDSVSWVDLDSIDGSTGVRTSTDEGDLPGTGASTGAPLPANASILVTKSIDGGRVRRNGRMYLAGWTEGNTQSDDGNRLTAAALSGLNDALALFLEETEKEGGGIDDWSASMRVVHITERDASGNPLAGVSSDVNTLTADGLLATQRRRLRR